MFTNEVVTGAQLYIPVNIPMYSHYIPIFPGLPWKSHEISPFPIGFWHCSLGSASPWNPLPHSYLSCSSVVPCDTGMVKTCKDWMDVFFFEKHRRNWAILAILVSNRNLRFPESSPNFNSTSCFQLHFGMTQIYSNDKTPSYDSHVLPSYSIDLAGQTSPDQWTLALNDEWRRKTTKSCWNIYQVIGLNSQDDFSMF